MPACRRHGSNEGEELQTAPPIINCGATDFIPSDNWDNVRAAFAGADFVPFVQGWRIEPIAGFAPARAAALWNRSSLLVYAELEDKDIFNAVPAADFNRLAIGHGDVFEVFVQPEGQDAYFEMHLSPNNQQFQLRIPFPYAFRELRATVNDPMELVERFKVKAPLFESRIHQQEGKWEALMAIALDRLCEVRPVAVGAIWKFSFSRYDYTRPEPKPTLSSTSPHREANFHRIEEWGELRFV